MPNGLNILGASDKELIVMCLESLERIEEMLRVPTARAEKMISVDVSKTPVISKAPVTTPITKGSGVKSN